MNRSVMLYRGEKGRLGEYLDLGRRLERAQTLLYGQDGFIDHAFRCSVHSGKDFTFRVVVSADSSDALSEALTQYFGFSTDLPFKMRSGDSRATQAALRKIGHYLEGCGNSVGRLWGRFRGYNVRRVPERELPSPVSA